MTEEETKSEPTLSESVRAIWVRVRGKIDTLGRWRVIVVVALALSFALILMAYLGVESQPVPPPPLPPAPPQYSDESLFKDPGVQRFLLGLAACVLGIALLAFTYDVGKIRLSAQSLAHRRNVMFVFCVVLLAEIFSVNIGETLGIKTSPSETPGIKTSPGEAQDMNSYAYGILGFFLIYSFVEYCFTFSSDYLRSRADWKKNDSVVHGSAVFMIGLYRVLFDILLPALALAYVLTFFLTETKTFVFMAKQAIACKHPELERAPKDSINWAKQSLDEIEARFPDAKHAADDVRSAIDATSTSAESTSWFTCSRQPMNNP